MTLGVKIGAAIALLVLMSWMGVRAADTVEPGRQVFFSQGCYGCHRIGIVGTPIANDLAHVGQKYSASQLAQWLRDPASQKPTAHMPRLALSEQEIQSLAAYLATLR